MSRDPSVGRTQPSQAEVLLALYPRALPQVYGYVVARVGRGPAAEDLTAETFLAAATAVERGSVAELTVAWLIGVARHKVVDHWRRLEREQRGLRLVHDRGDDDHEVVDPFERFERSRAREVLAALGPHHRSALSLRYLDGLAVPDVAAVLGRTVHATEALLVRARNAFRRAYTDGAEEGSGA